LNLSKYLNKFCLFLFVIFIFLLFPIISYASFNNNAGGSSSSTASGNGLGNSTKTLYSDTSGYRITLIDPETDEVKSKSIDILFSTPPTSNVYKFTTSRVEVTGRCLQSEKFRHRCAGISCKILGTSLGTFDI